MNPEWLCYVNGQEYGPYTWPQLVQMAAAGNVVPSTHVRRNFDSQWYLAEHVPGLFAAPAAPVSPTAAVHPSIQPRNVAVGKVVSKSGAHAAVSAVTQAPIPQSAPVAQQPPAYPQQQPAVPKGRVVSAAPTAVTPVADTRPHPIAVNTATVATHAAPASAHTDDEPIPGKKIDNSKQMVLYLGGAIVGVAVLGGAALIWNFTRPPAAPKEIAVAPVILPKEESDPNSISEEAASTAEVNSPEVVENGKPANNAVTKAAAKKVDVAAVPQNPLVKSIAAWKPIEKFGSVGAKSGLTCTKLSAYLAADATGRRVAVRSTGGVAAPVAREGVDNGTAAAVAPVVDGNAVETPPIAAPIAAPPAAPAGTVKYVSAEAAPFLFVEMTITNRDTKPLTYAGWNNGETAALLVDAAGKAFSMVPVSGTPNVMRHAAGKEVNPGEAIQDTLVFAVPPNSDLLFRLVLPRPAFSTKLAGAWGYEIGGVALANAAVAAGAIPGQPTGPIGRQPIPIPGLQEPPPLPPPVPVQPAPAVPAEPEMKKPVPKERIPIPGLTDEPENKPKAPQEVPKASQEVPNPNPTPAKTP